MGENKTLRQSYLEINLESFFDGEETFGTETWRVSSDPSPCQRNRAPQLPSTCSCFLQNEILRFSKWRRLFNTSMPKAGGRRRINMEI